MQHPSHQQHTLHPEMLWPGWAPDGKLQSWNYISLRINLIFLTANFFKEWYFIIFLPSCIINRINTNHALSCYTFCVRPSLSLLYTVLLVCMSCHNCHSSITSLLTCVFSNFLLHPSLPHFQVQWESKQFRALLYYSFIFCSTHWKQLWLGEVLFFKEHSNRTRKNGFELKDSKI